MKALLAALEDKSRRFRDAAAGVGSRRQAERRLGGAGARPAGRVRRQDQMRYAFLGDRASHTPRRRSRAPPASSTTTPRAGRNDVRRHLRGDARARGAVAGSHGPAHGVPASTASRTCSALTQLMFRTLDAERGQERRQGGQRARRHRRCADVNRAGGGAAARGSGDARSGQFGGCVRGWPRSALSITSVATATGSTRWLCSRTRSTASVTVR